MEFIGESRDRESMRLCGDIGLKFKSLSWTKKVVPLKSAIVQKLHNGFLM